MNTYTRNTQAIQVQPGAAVIDKVAKILEMVFQINQKLLKNEEVDPLLDGMRRWSGRRPVGLTRRCSSVKDASSSLETGKVRPATPNTEELRTDIANVWAEAAQLAEH